MSSFVENVFGIGLREGLSGAREAVTLIGVDVVTTDSAVGSVEPTNVGSDLK